MPFTTNGQGDDPFADPNTPKTPAYTPPTLEEQMTGEAGSIYRQEQDRYTQGVGLATDAYNRSRSILEQLIDPNLLFSKAADSIGAQGKMALSNLRSNLGARGLNPNSGAAQGLLSRLITGQQGNIIGAQRDIALANQQQRIANAGIDFSNALNLANLVNAPVSGIKYENLQNLFEGQIAREGIQSLAASQRSASKDNKAGSLGGGVLGLAGSAVGK